VSRGLAVKSGPSNRVVASVLVCWAFCAGACSNKPPPDFAPDPALVQRISEIRMYTDGEWVCPGNTIHASYDAVLDDGSVIPFDTRYDRNHPPALHVVFLRRTSREAAARQDGSWDTNSDPVISATTGFRLNAFLLANPAVNVNRVVGPEYSCTRHSFSFIGEAGQRGSAGETGPDVEVRLNVLSSPFYERLLVAGVRVGYAPTVYAFANADRVPPADWLIVESRGGPGGRGVNGAEGAKGAKGTDGCPAGTGGAGGRGGNGGVGGQGGPGGRVAVMVPSDQPLLAGLVETHSSGGLGGKGGAPGSGGAGGEGGDGMTGARRCTKGQAGPAGEDGVAGSAGPEGSLGPRAQIVTVPGFEVFVDPRLQPLIDYSRSGGS